MTKNVNHSSNGAHSSAVIVSRGIFRWGRVSVAVIAKYLEKRRSRIALSELADHQLRDIGVTRKQASTEVSKSWF
ncbi:hypothetical protein BLM14_29215 (plasmid) [Phyllobacterium zundukense]|uniref:DUF1127 domain-containing protein n=1 Tax=Phyllobacterium zundukense TaxID=1867719 RepID=UPI000C1BB8D8|nr:DUF1127 domain-containing protein [Phyllobacterium zundukense]ATU95820.1 hypothetical protein BLM14_29215 [Phyllobacterium zundukense]